jgi:hypothetical protein
MDNADLFRLFRLFVEDTAFSDEAERLAHALAVA